ncbi:MAG TPA: hypothetical protein VFI84_01390 [Candidatus Saccharimonadales bacterium]|nr:hypothetical protein [Candidatus Saccharimonadales bacterium]
MASLNMLPQTNKNYSKPKSSRRFISAVLLFGLVAGLVILFSHQAVYDWLRLYNYQAPSDIASIATSDDMTPSARRIFYVNHPVIEGKSTFASSCPNGSKETAVLGCYIPNQRGIYVLSVTDTRLQGIEEVTAAHEMLHAAYDRLGDREKQQVNGWLQDYYNNLTDQTIKDQIDSYKKTEPNDLVNEMHSIFGSEVSSLPANLENYYKKYFMDRSKVTAQYAAYETEFTSRQAQIKQDDAQLQSLKAQINSLEADLRTKQADLSSQQQLLNSYKRSGNIQGYNAAVPGYNSLVDDYNAEVAEVRNLVAQYNRLVAERNAIALEEQQLVQDISSNISPIGNQ